MTGIPALMPIEYAAYMLPFTPPQSCGLGTAPPASIIT